MAYLSRDCIFTDDEVDDLLERLDNFLGHSVEAEFGIDVLRLSEIEHFIKTVN